MIRAGDAARDPKVPDETDEIVWLTPGEAMQKVTHIAERELIAQLSRKTTEASNSNSATR